MARIDFATKTGPLTEEELDEICRLAEDEKLKAWSIAKRLHRHPSSVSWHLWRMGLKPLGAKKKPFMRGGRMVVPFTPEEDRFMVGMRISGHLPIEIARMMLDRFGRPRKRDTVAHRLMMLASHDACLEVA